MRTGSQLSFSLWAASFPESLPVPPAHGSLPRISLFWDIGYSEIQMVPQAVLEGEILRGFEANLERWTEI